MKIQPKLSIIFFIGSIIIINLSEFFTMMNNATSALKKGLEAELWVPLLRVVLCVARAVVGSHLVNRDAVRRGRHRPREPQRRRTAAASVGAQAPPTAPPRQWRPQMTDAAEQDLIGLYSKRILALAADIPHAGRLDGDCATARVRSPVCGSTVTVDLPHHRIVRS